EAPWRSFCTYFAFCAEGFLVRTFKRSKRLGVLFALIVPILPKVFWFGPLKGRSPLAFFLHLLCLLCRRFFGSDLSKVEAPWRSFCTYCAFCAEGFLVLTFKRSKPLGVLFALIVLFVPKVFWFGPLKRRSLL